MVARIAVNGFGTIGKRVARAVRLQDDMEIVGVTKTRPTYEARLANREGFPLYVADSAKISEFREQGIQVEGSLSDLLTKVDLVVDCTPEGRGAENKKLYEEAGVKAIFQGGEEHEVSNLSFNAFASYDQAYGRKFARVVSCNTTGLIRTLYPLDRMFRIEEVFAAIIRRGADPAESKGSALNAVEPSLHVPTHHGLDVRTVMPGLKISTMAAKVPTTNMHVHCIYARLKKQGVTTSDVLSLWDQMPRIKFVSGKHGIRTSGQIMEIARDLGRHGGDFAETIVWEDGTHVDGSTLYYYQAVHQESDVIPENIDCIRSMMEIEKDASKSIRKTDRSLGLV
ncbi:MAG: type II glyceraldehyde-3-phosphate dehydrogenase [Candidatus Thermoplasmatota archaeon]|uniref:Glyceraldehyde-3-phosphate dehydrogenase n=2 Tax=Candidatus Sysuiplasma superficiale TaxID=2823368 RepID=A0A8J8CB11_9ARCH|nr:type II glyceraldehyde-3-phosphate dehydrogenase [Candidatus Sysuiplasma superficiale]MCL4347323.1 type II glyceraldehyde-3-phosphate dehydrogenase [Candidatus Thermoplasmatota archaeon]